ncbi:Pentatricopeptide repeat-containing protein [Thalictrum thalictroides]|uniref:Pentatricopeptide repeat-containing protein n=1 Tax=Thalictrum thalictroides TaxID=46969 RepID=A0A7J6W1F2_THATH|nr:Pentatricopeptide repeat-containing protein [Thalictrum thalictroides]
MKPSNNKYGMEIFRTYKKLRYFLNPNSLYSLLFTSQFLSSSFSSKSLVSTINPTSFLSSTQNPKPHISRLCYTTSSSGSFQLKSKFPRRNSKNKLDNLKKVEEIVKVVKLDKSDMETELNKMGLILSLDLISEVFRGLNADEVSGFRFFYWVREKDVSFYRNSDFCSLAIDNLGRIEDYTLMLVLLKEFSKETLCLTEKSFEFLRVFNLNRDLVREYVMRVINMLNKIGGSSRNSGIFALIKMLCRLKSFDLAVFVMEETARKTSYYNVLIWAKCRTCDFQEAYGLLDEMRRIGCDPNANSYNYLLGSLCKHSKTAEASELFATMEEFGYIPDAVTFEVIIYHACRLSRLDFAVEFLNQMISSGIEPRYTTHAAIIKGYFYIDRSQEAYLYVVDMCEKCKCSANMNYSLLASLFQRSGRVVESRAILVDMIDKGLKPNFPVYIKVMKDLHKSSMGYLVADLKSRFSKFNSNTKDF